MSNIPKPNSNQNVLFWPIKCLPMGLCLNKTFYLIMAFSALGNISVAQVQETKVAAYLDGTLGFSAGDGFYTLNIGGPSFSLVFDEGFKIGVGAWPSLHSQDGKVTPKLGLGPRIDFKKVSIIAPFFPSQPSGKWAASLGLAYRFRKRR
ncbi:MAG: hypothetical protein ACO3RO_04720 [Flavobacteriaceae bacterium]